MAPGAGTVVRMDEFSFDMPTTFTAGTPTFEVVTTGSPPTGSHSGPSATATATITVTD